MQDSAQRRKAYGYLPWSHPYRPPLNPMPLSEFMHSPVYPPGGVLSLRFPPLACRTSVLYLAKSTHKVISTGPPAPGHDTARLRYIVLKATRDGNADKMILGVFLCFCCYCLAKNMIPFCPYE